MLSPLIEAGVNEWILIFRLLGPASVDSSSPPAPSSSASATTTTIVAPTVAPAPQIQPAAAAAFAHLNNTYLDASSQRNAYVSYCKTTKPMMQFNPHYFLLIS